MAAALPPGDHVFVRAPGRVNLMGGHTDYNEGLVLPVAIDLECVVAAKLADEPLISLRSLDVAGPEPLAEIPADGSLDASSARPDWGRLVAGVVAVLAEKGRPPAGMDATVASSVPMGSGLSSSAAFEVALALALCRVASFEIDRTELALACRAAEERSTGVPCGVMDQMASVFGVERHALLIDCRLTEVTPVAIDPSLSIVAVHSGLPRRLASSGYAERQAECFRLASSLGLRSLRDATPHQVADHPYGRHVVSEIARVPQAAEALASGDLEALGRLFSSSHASLRDDYRVSTPELDLLAGLLVEKGAAGARITGAGFGGCVVGVIEDRTASVVAGEALAEYRERTRLPAVAFPCVVSRGAGEIRA